MAVSFGVTASKPKGGVCDALANTLETSLTV
jgi:hypothetical protein